MSALTGLAKFKDIFFKANKIDPKEIQTADTLLKDTFKFEGRIRPTKNIESFVSNIDELPKKEINLNSSELKNIKVNVDNLAENLFENLQNKKGYLDPGTISKGNLRQVSKAYNLEKAYLEQDKTAKNTVLNYLTKRPEIFKKDFEGIKSLGLISKKTSEKFKPLYDFYNTETKIKTPSTQAIIENIITKKYPSKNFFESMKLFKANNPGVNSEFDFLIKNKNEIDKVSESFFNKKPLNVIQDNIRHLIYSSKIFNRKQKQSLMSEARKKGELTKINEPEVSAPSFAVRERIKLQQQIAPETIINPRGEVGFYTRGFRSELEGKYLPGLTPEGNIVKSPAELFNIHHRTNMASLVALDKAKLFNDVIPQAAKYPNLMVLSKLSNETLQRYESYSNTILRQMVKDIKKYNNLADKQSDKALTILDRVKANNIKFEQIELSIPPQYRDAFNPVIIKNFNKLTFKPLKPMINEFESKNPVIAYQTGLLRGLEREGITRKKLINTQDKVYKLILDEIKRGKLKTSNIVPIEKLKFNKGGIVGLQNIKA
jgi:hypothetical protein